MVKIWESTSRGGDFLSDWVLAVHSGGQRVMGAKSCPSPASSLCQLVSSLWRSCLWVVMSLLFIRLTPQCLWRETMSPQIAPNQMAFCNYKQASYEYEFIIVQLQAVGIIFTGIFIYLFIYFLLLAGTNYRISILRQSRDKGEAFSVCCHYIILLNVKHPSGRAVFVTKLRMELHLPNWVVMSCQEWGLGDWLSAGCPVPVGCMGRPPCYRSPAGLSGRGMVNDLERLNHTGCGETSARLGVYLCCLLIQCIYCTRLLSSN